MFLTRDLTVSVLSRVVSQAVSISIKANNPYRTSLPSGYAYAKQKRKQHDH
jgi:hypothetical protein